MFMISTLHKDFCIVIVPQKYRLSCCDHFLKNRLNNLQVTENNLQVTEKLVACVISSLKNPPYCFLILPIGEAPSSAVFAWTSNGISLVYVGP